MSSPLIMIAGLGNPGSQYDKTRHNVGFICVDLIAQDLGVSVSQNKFESLLVKTRWHGCDVILIKPQTYMNLSGKSIRQALAYYKIPEEQLIVVFDDLDQVHGAVKMRIGGGHGGHNGIRSILEETNSDKFYRVKIGIGKPEFKTATADWVLSPFTEAQRTELEDQSFPAAKKRIEEIIKTINKNF
jgi:PTH1 family peptidyl-tRNA hydrolase